jgi:plastocyanin
MMNINKDSLALAITAFSAAAALFAALSKNLNAGQLNHHTQSIHGFDISLEQPASPGYRYYSPGDRSRMQEHILGTPVHSSSHPVNQSTDLNTTVNKVTIYGMQYLPATIRIKAGDQVNWTNLEAMPHTVTSHYNGLVSSHKMGPGSSYTHIFKQPGIHTYYCVLHPSMTGAVIVE